jgi:hypothetical protein
MLIDWALLLVALVGGLIGLVAYVWLVYTAFRVSLAWGLAVLFLSWLVVPTIVFVIQNWHETRRPVMLWAVGVVISLAGYLILFVVAGNEARARFRQEQEMTARAGAQPDAQAIPGPRPTARPTYPPWEKLIEETIAGNEDETWESIVATPTMIPDWGRPPVITWDKAPQFLGRLVTVELTNGTEITGGLEAVEPTRLRIRHVIGGGDASYWIPRKNVAEIRPGRR